MKKQNRTGKIKTIILAVLSLPNLISPAGVSGQQNVATAFMLFIFGVGAVLLVTRVSSKVFGREVMVPDWNDNPLTIKKPLSFTQFCSFFFLVVGGSILLGTAIKFYALSFYGLSLISFGLGMLTGIRLVLKGTAKKV